MILVKLPILQTASSNSSTYIFDTECDLESTRSRAEDELNAACVLVGCSIALKLVILVMLCLGRLLESQELCVMHSTLKKSSYDYVQREAR